MVSFKIIPMTPEHYTGAIEVLRHTFFRDENICKCVRILQDSPEVLVDPNPKYVCTAGTLELEALCLETAKEGLSVVAVDTTDESHVLGVAFNKIQIRESTGQLSFYEKFIKDYMKDPSAIALMEFVLDLDNKINLFDYFKADCGLEFTFFAVKSSHRGHGIGTALAEETIKLAKAYNGTPKIEFVCASFSSPYSQKAGIRGGIKTILEIPYEEYSYKGVPYKDVLGPNHTFGTLSGVKI